MFKISLQPTYTHKVDVELPGGAQYSFTAVFARVSQSELDRIVSAVNDGSMNDDDVVREVLRGWEGVKDEAGTDLPFNPDTMRMVLDIVPLRPTIVRAFFTSLRGARAKN